MKDALVEALRAVDPVGLKAAQRRRDADGEAAAAGSAKAADKPAAAEKPAVDFTRPGPEPTPAQKARRASRLSELLKAREAEDADYADAWSKAK